MYGIIIMFSYGGFMSQSVIFFLLSCFSPPERWDVKDSFRKCLPMIKKYPNEPSPDCQALHMCANEARLSKEEYQRLIVIIQEKPGCDGP